MKRASASAKINLSQTYTNRFVLKALKSKAPAAR